MTKQRKSAPTQNQICCPIDPDSGIAPISLIGGASPLKAIAITARAVTK
jgi:hypothetical protein